MDAVVQAVLMLAAVRVLVAVRRRLTALCATLDGALNEILADRAG